MAEPLADLYTELRGPIFRFLLHLTGEPNLAEELTQETFFQAVRSLPRFHGESSMTTWLYAIARNVHRKSVAQAERRRRLVHPPEPCISTTEIVEARDEQLRLVKALADLPSTYREALVLREYQELSYAQVGQVLGGTENWARVTCFRARRQLREAYLKNGGGMPHED